MSGKSLLVHVRLSEKILIKIDNEIDLANVKSSARPWTRSSWIRHAIEYQLEIQAQRRKVRGPKKYVCSKCKRKIAEGEIAYSSTLLTGAVETVCDRCSKK